MAKKALVTGMVLGTIVGSAYGLLFAQKKGSALRAELLKKYKESGDLYDVLTKEIKMTAQDAGETLKMLYKSDDVQNFMKASKKKMDVYLEEYKEKGEDYINGLRGKIETLAKSAYEKVKEEAEKHMESVSKQAKNGVKKVEKKVKTVQKKLLSK